MSAAVSQVRTTEQNADQHRGMQAVDFANHVMPSAGIRVLMLMKEKGGAPVHKVYSTTAEMVSAARVYNETYYAVYFAVNGFGDEYEDVKTGKKTVRKQENVVACRSLFDDFDVDTDKTGAYDSKAEAKEGLLKLFNAIGLVPTIVSSGGGYHSYITADKDFDAATWLDLSIKKRAICEHLVVLSDPAVNKDSARVLRLAGCTNNKHGATVKVVKQGMVYTLAEINDALDSFIEKNNVTLKQHPQKVDAAAVVNPFAGAVEEYPPSYAEEIAKKCIAIRAFKAGEHNDDLLSEPLWHRALGVVKHCVNGEKIAHEWSAMDERYDDDQTQLKMDNWTAGPTLCEEFNSHIGCMEHCPVAGKYKSPIQLGYAGSVNNCESTWLERMNGQYAWIDRDAGVYRIKYRDFIAMEKFHAAHANDLVEINEGKFITASKGWLSKPLRRQHSHIVCRPDEPDVTAQNELNEWRGYAVKPIAGDIRPWEKLYRRMFGTEKRPLQWLAHKIQKPGIKMHTCLVVWSRDEGVGKNLLFESVGSLFDPYHFELISQAEVNDTFTGWMPGTLFVVGDEIRASKREAARDRIKIWITASSLKSHEKNQPKRTIENYMDFVFLSNHPDALAISDHDRRIDPYEVKSGRLPEHEAKRFVMWRDSGGLSHLLYYLHNVDLSGFNPKVRAPMTEDKLNMISAGCSDLDAFCRDVVTGAIPLSREVVTGDEVARKFAGEYPSWKTPQAATVSKVLVKMGAFARSSQVRLDNGRKVRCLAITHVDHWKNASESEWRKELDKPLRWDNQ